MSLKEGCPEGLRQSNLAFVRTRGFGSGEEVQLALMTRGRGCPPIAPQVTYHPEKIHSVTRPSVQVLYFNYNSATPKLQ